MKGWISTGFRNTHEPTQTKTWQMDNVLGGLRHLFWCKPVLVRLVADVDLQTNLHGRQMRWPLGAEAFGSFEAVDRMNPIEIFSHHPRFVALQWADQVPGDLRAQIRQGRDFFQSFLNVVFTKMPLTGFKSRPHRLRAEGFAHHQERDTLLGPTGREAGRCHLLPDLLYVVRDRSHNDPKYVAPASFKG